MICSLTAGCGKPVVTTKVAPNGTVSVSAGIAVGKPKPANANPVNVSDPAVNDSTAPSEPATATDSSPDGTTTKPVVVENGNATGTDSQATTAESTSSNDAASSAKSGNGPSDKPKDGEFVPPKPRRFKVEGPNGAVRINYDDLDVKKLLNLDNVVPGVDKKLPQWVKDLNGKTVRLRGYMKPGFQSEDITQFVFARDTGACCFGPNLRFDYLITVTLAPDKTTPLRDLTPFDVVGTFRIELIQIDDRTFVGPYHIDDAILLNK